jgi:hypothetical protein
MEKNRPSIIFLFACLFVNLNACGSEQKVNLNDRFKEELKGVSINRPDAFNWFKKCLSYDLHDRKYNLSRLFEGNEKVLIVEMLSTRNPLSSVQGSYFDEDKLYYFNDKNILQIDEKKLISTISNKYEYLASNLEKLVSYSSTEFNQYCYFVTLKHKDKIVRSLFIGDILGLKSVSKINTNVLNELNWTLNSIRKSYQTKEKEVDENLHSDW